MSIPENSIYNLRKIYLILGTACNFNCVYCVQHANKPRCIKTIHPNVIDWLWKVSYKLPKKLKPTIVFYGGEPLLYKQAIHQVVEQFKDTFNYTIISNGSLLTSQDVEFFNENHIHYTLSHDGACTKTTRGLDILEDEKFIDNLKKINFKSIDAVWSALNQNITKTISYFQDIPVHFEELMTTPETPKELTDFDIDSLLKDIKYAGESLLKQPGNESREFIGWLKIANNRLNKPTMPHCACGYSELGVDTQGNIYFCKNYNEKIGTIKDSFETLHQKATELLSKLYEENVKAKGCLECPVGFFCRGGCPFEKPSERQREKCKALIAKWQSVVSFIDNKLVIKEKKYEDI